MGGAKPRTSTTGHATPRSPTYIPLRFYPSRHSRAPLPVVPAPPSVIPAPLFPSFLRSHPSFLRRQEPPTKPNPHLFPFPNSSLPPFRGEARWGVEAREPAPPVMPRPDRPRRTSVRRPLAFGARPDIPTGCLSGAWMPPEIWWGDASPRTVVPACAGMTDGSAGATRRGAAMTQRV